MSSTSGLFERMPTAPLAAAGLIGGFATAMSTGSRTLGGFVMAAFGLTCIYFWIRRDGIGPALRLTLVGLAMFVLAHGLGRLVGAWPAVMIVAAATAWIYWRLSDAKLFGAQRAAVHQL